MSRFFLTLMMAGLVLTGVVAQEIVEVGGPGAIGCQDPNAPVLSNGDPATATVTYDYDPITGVLSLTVENTTPVHAMGPTPTIQDIFLPMPLTVTGAVLLTQTQAAGATAPSFNIFYGANTVACLGTFDVTLASPSGISGGIANAAATNLPGSSGSQVTGPVTFELAISSANPALLTSASFAQALTPDSNLGVSMKFQGSGPQDGSGFIGTAPCFGITAISQSLGFGCGNWMGMDPVLTVDAPALGTTMNILLDSEFPGALYWLVASVGQPTPTCVNMQGQIVSCNDPSAICTIHIDLFDLNNIITLSIGLADANGDYMLSLPIPQSANPLVGLEFTIQARMCAPNAPIQGPFQDWFSNAVFIRFGCP